VDGHTVPSTLLPYWSRRALREVIGNHKQGYLYKDPNQPRTYCIVIPEAYKIKTITILYI
jgi:hypothetical protein